MEQHPEPVPSTRLIASDLDGTLLRSDGTVSPRTREAIAAMAAAGLMLVLVTGRPPRWMGPVVEGTGHRGVAVCANGGVVLDLASGRVVSVHPIPPDDAGEAVDILRRVLPGVSFAVERVRPGAGLASGGPGYAGAPDGDPTEFAHESTYHPRYRAAPGTTVAPVRELVRGGDVVKLLARAPLGPDLDVDAAFALAVEALEGCVEVTHSTADGLLLEMSAAGVTKASGLAAVAAAAAVPAAAVAAVGDMPNDVPMLRWAGHACAVANAHPWVLAVSDEVLPSNDDDGVASLIERSVGTSGRAIG